MSTASPIPVPLIGWYREFLVITAVPGPIYFVVVAPATEAVQPLRRLRRHPPRDELRYEPPKARALNISERGRLQAPLYRFWKSICGISSAPRPGPSLRPHLHPPTGQLSSSSGIASPSAAQQLSLRRPPVSSLLLELPSAPSSLHPSSGGPAMTFSCHRFCSSSPSLFSFFGPSHPRRRASSFLSISPAPRPAVSPLAPCRVRPRPAPPPRDCHRHPRRPAALKQPKRERLLSNIQFCMDVSSSRLGPRPRDGAKAIELHPRRARATPSISPFPGSLMAQIPAPDLAAIHSAMPPWPSTSPHPQRPALIRRTASSATTTWSSGHRGRPPRHPRFRRRQPISAQARKLRSPSLTQQRCALNPPHPS